MRNNDDRAAEDLFFARSRIAGKTRAVSKRRQFIASLFCVLTISGHGVVMGQTESEVQELAKYVARKASTQVDKFPYDRYYTLDKLDRRITFYVSKPPRKLAKKIPLVVCIQGSGSQSVFLEVDTPNGKAIGSGGPEAAVLRSFRERVRVVVVEKPGVEFLDQPSVPGSAEEGSLEFNREFSLLRWAEAVGAATRAAMTLPEVDASRTLVMGHSEGGQVACEVAARNDKVTHVAVLAGGGPTQLFDLIQLARDGAMYDPQQTSEQRVAMLLADWKKVTEEPNATDKFILGHTHLRWSSFLRSSPVDAILRSDANVYIAQGTADTNTFPLSSEVLYAELLARDRACAYERIDGGDHAFMTSDGEGDGWIETNKKTVEWFLNYELEEPSS